MQQAQKGGGDVSLCSGTIRLSNEGIEPRRKTMKGLILITALLMACGSAYADSCKIEAGNKKLAGAAMTSFMKKCETDAKAACDKSAAEKKLAGAAKDSFTKKCVSDAVGS
jgi:hypothetical protein